MTAYHEAGHALLAWLLPGMDRLHKVTIIPRGRALGVTQLLPEEDRLNIGETELRNRLVFMLGGRAAEKLVYNEYSAGAENDLTQCTKLARRMVAHWGMSERLGPVAFRIERGASVPGPRNLRAAGVQRAHGADHRRGDRPHSAQRIGACGGDVGRRTAASSIRWPRRWSRERSSMSSRSSSSSGRRRIGRV